MTVFYIIGVELFIIIIYLFLSGKKGSKLSFPKNMPLVMVYDKDIAYLNYIIDHKIDIFNKQFSIAKIRRSTYIYDFNLENDKIVDEVYSSLSDFYKMTLYKYMTDDELIRYICQNVYIRLLKVFETHKVGIPVVDQDFIKGNDEERREEVPTRVVDVD